jgi:hypothetical protein
MAMQKNLSVRKFGVLGLALAGMVGLGCLASPAQADRHNRNYHRQYYRHRGWTATRYNHANNYVPLPAYRVGPVVPRMPIYGTNLVTPYVGFGYGYRPY